MTTQPHYVRSWILFHLAKISAMKGFSFVHELVRKSYATWVPVLLKKWVNWASPFEPCEINPRRSSTVANEFNVFMSDLDLEILVRERNDARFDRIKRRLNQAKRLFPSLGEYEFYTYEEKQLYSEMFSSVGPIYSLLRDARKIGWMERRLNESVTPYHRSKAERAIRKSLKTFERSEDFTLAPRCNLQTVSKQFCAKIKKYFPDLVIASFPQTWSPVWVDYLGFFISPFHHQAVKENQLSVDAESAAILFSISPGFAPSEPWSAIVKELRQEPRLNRTYKELSILEHLIAKAVRRGHPDVISLEWIDALERSAREASSLTIPPK